MAQPTFSQIVLASRPQGRPQPENFRMEEAAMPAMPPGGLLLRVLYLSLDPYMRGRMNAGKSYAAPVEIGATMVGGIVGKVIASENQRFALGDIVEGRLGWQDFGVSDGRDLRKVDPKAGPISTAVGVLGMPGLTAYFGLLDICQPRPGDTVVVSAASGAVGQVVGQIAKLMGCRVVGIAGDPRKLAFITQELGFDAAIDYKTEDLDAALDRACPSGIDAYF